MFLNPYTAGNPIGGQTGFFGRDDILREVTQVLHHPQSNAIVLYGQRRIGKTSMLLQLERQLADLAEYLPVYFDLQDKADKPLEDVLYELAQRISAVTGQVTPNRDLFDSEGAYFRDEFVPQAAEMASNGGLVLLFDEFDVLDSPKEDQAGIAFFPYLRQWMGNAKGVQFVFVIGRRPEDLSINTISTFKGVRATRVSLLDPDDAAAVVRQSQEEGSLLWPDEVVERVWQWSQGHPYFTQLLCSVVWENAYEDEPDDAPTVTPGDVNNAVDEVLKQGANAFVWIWDGLPPAERVVISAMAEAKERFITHDDLVDILNKSGVRLIVRQLELAPETLVEWELLQPANGGYQFTVLLLRRWVQKNRPLNRTKEELDLLDPQAESLFQTGLRFYQSNQLDVAGSQLRLALQSNPNHLKAQLLLGQLLLEQTRLDEAVTVLEEAYQYDQQAAKADLVRALLALANEPIVEQFKLVHYERILEIQPDQPIALSRKDAIIAAERKRQLSAQVKKAARWEQEEKWEEAIKIYDTLLKEFPEEAEWKEKQERAKAEANLQQKYNEALGAQETDNESLAQRLLADVIYQQPDYKEAASHLLQATKRINVAQLQEEHKQSKIGFLILQRENKQLQARLHELEALVPHQQTPPPSTVQKETANAQGLRKLSAINPLDYVRLLWWVFMAPQQLKLHKEKYGDMDSIGRWTTSSLIWTPLLLLTSAAASGTLPLTALISPTTYLKSLGIILLAWLLTGMLGDKYANDNLIRIVAFVLAIVVASIVAANVIDNVAFGLVSGVLVAIAVGFAVVVAEGVTAGLMDTSMVHPVGLGVAISLTVFVAGIMAVFMVGGGAVESGIAIFLLVTAFLFWAELNWQISFGVGLLSSLITSLIIFFLGEQLTANNIITSIYSILTGSVALSITFGLAFGLNKHDLGGLAGQLDDNIELGKSSSLARGVGWLMLVSYAFLIWFAYLGGASVLAGS